MKTEVQIDGEWFELLGVHERGVGRLYVWVATDGNPMWVYQAASDPPLPTRPAPEAFVPTAHEPCEGVKLWVPSVAVDKTYCGAFVTVDGADAGSIIDGKCVTNPSQNRRACIPAKAQAWLEFTPALAAFRDRIRAERKAKPEPGPTLVVKARRIAKAADRDGASHTADLADLADLAAVVAELAEKQEARP